ncbi:hypothetical protein B0H19DRAFT_1253135 [Mycena capillaripes]|nr:hypothetical protein B0H19DRAFT_1253135 [Mycena capillaripes]
MTQDRAPDDILAPIECLPPEILAAIFVQCVPTSIRELQNDLNWLNLMKVSSHWRNVALTCPKLWSTLILSHANCTPIFLARSKMASLVIRADVKKLYHMSFVDSPGTIVLDNISRLGTLDLRSPQSCLTEFLFDNLADAGAASRLRCLKLVNTTVNDSGYGGMWLPHDLFRRTEVLESRKAQTTSGLWLHFERCAFPWDSPWYSHVTHLHLENINWIQRPTMEAFLAILIGSPALQTLSLIHCSPTTLDGFSVDLPRLSALTIRDNFPPTATLLGYLMIPRSATLNISFKIKSLEDSGVLLALIDEFSRASPTTYDTVRIIHRDGFAYSLLDSARPWWSRRFRIVGKSCQPYSNLCSATTAVVNHLDFSNVTTLHLHEIQGVLPDGVDGDQAAIPMWISLGESLRRVRTLHLHKTVPAELFKFLLTQAMYLLGLTHFKYNQYGLSSRGEDGELTYAWPGLQCLGLHGLDLGETTPLPHCNPPLPASRSDLLRALMWARREGGARIWQLEIEDCRNVLVQDLRHFRLFTDLVYDGKGLETTVEKDDGNPCLRSYSIDVFARLVNMHEDYRNLLQPK